MGDPILTPLIILGTGATLYGGKRQRDQMVDERGRQKKSINEAEAKQRDRERLAMEAQTMQTQRNLQKRKQLTAGQSAAYKTPGGILGTPGGTYNRPTLIGSTVQP